MITDLLNTIIDQANKKDSISYVICQPFLRLDPPWLEAKLPFYKSFLKTTHANTTNGNIHIGGEIDIQANDLKADRVHLNQEGMDKLFSVLVADLKTAKEDVEGLRSNVDMDDAPLSSLPRSSKKTPVRRKRTHDLESSEEEGKTVKKKTRSKNTLDAGKLDAVLAKLDKLEKIDKMMEDLHGDRSVNRARFDKLDEKLEETILVQENLKEQVEAMKQSDNTFTASIKEDLDAVENQNSRDTVIIKKLATDKTIPTDRKELSTMIMEAGKELLTDVMGSDTCMKFIAPLYFRNEKRVLKEGDRNEYPPFKINFKQLPDAIVFKEKVILASKDKKSKLSGCYVSNQQNVGTRVRLMLLWGIVDALKKDKKESWVNQSSPRPTLQVKQTGTVIKTFSYIEAISSYGERIEKKIIDEATKLAHRFFYGQVEKIFILLKD